MLTSGLPTPILQPGGLAHTEKPNVCSGQCAPLCLLPLSLTASRQGPETGDRLKTGECVSTINRRNSGHLNRLKYSKQFKLQGNQIFFLSSLWRIALQNSRSKVKLGHLKQPTLPTQANGEMGYSYIWVLRRDSRKFTALWPSNPTSGLFLRHRGCLSHHSVRQPRTAPWEMGRGPAENTYTIRHSSTSRH